MTDQTYATERLVHFESVGRGRYVQHEHADDHAHAVEEQTVGFHSHGAAVHGGGHETFDEPRQAQTQQYVQRVGAQRVADTHRSFACIIADDKGNCRQDITTTMLQLGLLNRILPFRAFMMPEVASGMLPPAAKTAMPITMSLM